MSIDEDSKNIRVHLMDAIDNTLKLESSDEIKYIYNSEHDLELAIHFKELFSLLKRIKTWPSTIALSIVEKIISYLKEINDHFRNRFDEETYPEQTKEGTFKIEHRWQEQDRRGKILLNKIGVTIGYLITLDQYYSKESYSSDEMLRQKQKYNDMLAEIGSMKSKADSLLKAQQNAARDTAISTHAIHFNTTSNVHRYLSIAWLAAAVGIAILTIIYRESLFFLNQDFKSGEESAYYILKGLSKFLFISIIFLFIYTCLRQFRAHIHNNVVNRHRTTALQTFQALVEASNDADTKNVVLLKVTEAIFMPVTTGFLTRESESKGSSQLIEIFQSALKK